MHKEHKHIHIHQNTFLELLSRATCAMHRQSPIPSPKLCNLTQVILVRSPLLSRPACIPQKLGYSQVTTGVLDLSEVLYKPFRIVHRIYIMKSSAELRLFTKHQNVSNNIFHQNSQEILSLNLIKSHENTWDTTHTSKHRNTQCIMILQYKRNLR